MATLGLHRGGDAGCEDLALAGMLLPEIKLRRGVKDARTATARKLAELTWTVWKEQRCYIER